MKNRKLTTLLNTPLGIVLVVGAIIALAELSIMSLIHDQQLVKMPLAYGSLLDAILLTSIVAPLLYFLVFRKIQESEARLRMITATAQDAIIVTDGQARIAGWNLAAQRMFQYSPEEALGQPLHQLIVPLRYRADAERGFVRFQASGSGAVIGKTTEIAALRRDGSEFPVELSLSAVRLKGCWHAIGVVRDITERKRAEEELLLRARLLDSTIDSIFMHDFDGNFVYLNEAAWKTRGYTRDELMGMNLHVLDTPEYEKLIVPRIRELMEKGQNIFEAAHRRKDGSVLPVEVSARIIESGGRKLILTTVRDITARRQAEGKLRETSDYLESLINHANAPIVVWDTSYRITLFNHAFERLTSLKADEVIGQPIELLFPADCKDAALSHIRQAQMGELWESVEIPIRHTSGEVRTALWNSATIYSADGKNAVATIAQGQDITERKKMTVALQDALREAKQSRHSMLNMLEDEKRAEEAVQRLNAELEGKVTARTAALEQARLEAERASRAKSDFLATMSHEIRTPMNGVIGMIEVLQQSSLNAQQLEITHIIHDSAFSLLTVINDILDFSKIEAGKLTIDRLPMSILDIVEGVGETLEPLAKAKGVELTLFTDPDIPETVIGDPGRVRQILLNLTNNAIKFCSERQQPARASLRAVRVESGAGARNPELVTVEFRIADNGIGMDAATQARLFTAFTQADSSITRHYGGTGLGLAISGHLIDLMGGKITVHSEPGQGSLFSVFLTFALPPVGRDSSRHVGLKPDLLIDGLSCLVLVDTEGIAADLAAYLAHDHAAVERATDLAAARQWIAEHPPGLCVVVIDTSDNEPPLDELRAAAHSRPGLVAHFVVVRRGRRIHCRTQAEDLVTLDANVLHHHAFLEAMAVAAGRLQPPEQQNLPGTLQASAHPPRAQAKRQGRLILVAEDNEINQKVILQQLALLGEMADVACNGREALEKWRSGDYALLFADLNMPEMDGYELAQAIRAAEASASQTRRPIIAFTANALKGEEEHCLAIGMDDYLSKPVQLAKLKAMLDKWLPVVESVPDAGRDLSRHVGLKPDLQSAPPDVGTPDVGRDLSRQIGLKPDLQSEPPDVGMPVAVDVAVLRKLVGDDEAIIRDFLHDFRLSATETAVELRTACAAGEAAAAGALAHRLKSSARSVGALALGELCAAMEQAGKADDMKALAELLPGFEAELASVEGFLAGY